MNLKTQPALAQDLFASIVVFLVALPLCMGVAIASGVPPALGLITGIVGGVLVGALAGAPLQVSGPAAGLTIIVFELVQTHGLQALGPVLVLAGLLQILAGAARLGQWFRAISPAVIYGMLAGIGILILASQFHVMVDDKPRAGGLANLLSIPESIVKGLTPEQGLPHNEAAMLGILTVLTLMGWSRFAPRKLSLLPGALVAVTLASGIAAIFRLPVQYVPVPSNLLDAVRTPDFTLLLQSSLVLEALALAFVASAETLLSAAAVDRMQSGSKTNYDRELAAQGAGNLVCGFLGALPMTGVIVRSSANVQAGARTRRSAIFHGLWLLAFVVAAPFLLRSIPVSALAAVLVYTGFKLVDARNLAHLRRYGRMPVVIYFSTIAGIVVFDLLTGVLIGVALSIVKLLYKVTHFHVTLQFTEPGRADLHLEGAATFLGLPRLARQLDSIPPGTTLHLHCDRLVYIDHSCLDLIGSWQAQHAESGSSLCVEWDHLLHRFHQPMARRKLASATASQ